MRQALAGKVVVVPVDSPAGGELASRLAGAGATVVLVGPDGEAAGRLAAAIEAEGRGRPAVFVTTGRAADLDALVELVAELFRPPGDQPPPA